MLLALFLLDLAAGLYLFLPLVGRRNAGVKFYRLMLIVSGAASISAAVAHLLAGRRDLAQYEAAIVLLTAIVYAVLHHPKRLPFRAASVLLAITYVFVSVLAWQCAIHTSLTWSIAGALSSVALLGSVSVAMLLGHWYLVVRGMSIDPLKRLTIATLVATIVKLLTVVVALVVAARDGSGYGTQFYRIAVGQGIFFWMRVGWGLAGPLVLYPMVWGTVKIRSTMAATGILYVAVVAVVIGEVLGAYLSAIEALPL